MKYNDHEFDPVTDEERAAREREEELARRIRKMKEASLFLLFVWISRMKQLYCVTDYLRYKYFGSPFSIIWETSPWISGCE